jgi:predicted Zn-dependent peptidase
MPRFEDVELRNGLRLTVVPKPKLPIVHLALQMRAGASAAAVPVPGLAAFTADMLDEGTASRTALEISDDVDFLGASLASASGYDRVTVSLNVLSSKLGTGLELLGDVVARPAFPEDELERVRERRKTRLLQRLDEPRALADTAFAHVLFGDQHPYGHPLLGNARTLGDIDRDDVVRYRDRFLHPANARLIAVGDVDARELASTLDSVLADWPAGDGRPAPGPFPVLDGRPGVTIVDKPGAPQSEIRVGRVGVARDTADYFPIVVLNTVLGGSFTSRLNRNLREDKGFTYGARSSFAARAHPGPFTASVAVHTPVTAEAVREIVREIRRIRDERVPAAELSRARSYVALRFPQRFETVRGVSGQVADVVLHDLPRDFLDTYVDRIQSVDADDVWHAAGRHLRMDDLRVVVAGDRQAIEGPLAALGLGEVNVLPPTKISGR